MNPTNEAAEPLTDRRDAAIGYALLETEHLPGFARRGPAFREKLAQAGYRIERQAAEATPPPDPFDCDHALVRCSHCNTTIYRDRYGPAPSLLQERDQLDSQALALLAACAERNIYSPFDMEYAFQPWAIDVERLAEALAATGYEAHPVDIVRWAGEIVAEYNLSAQPSTEPAQGGTDENSG